MRTILTLMLAILLCPAAFAEGVTLVPADALLPADTRQVWLTDASHALVETGDMRERFLLDLTTGVQIPLKLHENFDPGDHPLRRRIPEMALKDGQPVSGSLRFATSDRYVYVVSPASGYYVDRETGALQCVPGGELRDFGRTGLTPWEDVYDRSSRAVSVYSLEGGLLGRLQVDGDARIAGVIPVEQGFLIVTISDQARPDQDCYPLLNTGMARLVMTDTHLQVTSERELCRVPWVNKAFAAHRCGRTGALLISPDGYCGALLIMPDQTIHALVAEAGRMKLVPCQSAAEVWEGMYHVPAELIGVAEDGSCALLLLRGGGLYRLDLASLDVTQQMTNAQLEALGITGLPEILWPGGEYLTVSDGRLLRIVTDPAAE